MKDARELAWALVVVGVGAAVLGIALIYRPAALILGGLALAGLGLLVVDVGGPK